MRRVLAIAAAILLTAVTPAFAHRLDEYLMATTISVGTRAVRLEMRLIPGIVVLPVVLEAVDTNANGVIDEAEQGRYVESVLRDLVLTVDGARLPLRAASSTFSSVDAMRRGLGEIRLAFEAAVPSGGGNRQLHFENHHLSRIAAYMVNGLVSADPDIQFASQRRDYVQSTYDVSYVQTGAGRVSVSFGSLFRWTLLGGAIIVLLGQMVSEGRRRAIRRIEPAALDVNPSKQT